MTSRQKLRIRNPDSTVVLEEMSLLDELAGRVDVAEPRKPDDVDVVQFAKRIGKSKITATRYLSELVDSGAYRWVTVRDPDHNRPVRVVRRV